MPAPCIQLFVIMCVGVAAISFKAVSTCCAERAKGLSFSAHDMILLYDKNGDGRLSFEEFLEALNEPPYSLLSGWLQVMATSQLGPESESPKMEIAKISALSRSINLDDYA